MVSQFLQVMAYPRLDPAHFMVDGVAVQLYPEDSPLGVISLAVEDDGSCLF